MKIYSWNVNGIRAVLKKGTFQSFLAEHQPDILCLQETKAERAQVVIEVPGYHEYWNSAIKKAYSGTVIFSRQEAAIGGERVSPTSSRASTSSPMSWNGTVLMRAASSRRNTRNSTWSRSTPRTPRTI